MIVIKTVRLWLLCLLLCVPLTAWGNDPIDQILALVMSAHPDIISAEAVYAEQARGSRWSSDVRVTLSEGVSEYGGGGGLRASISLVLPIGNQDRRTEQAKAKRVVDGVREQVRQRLLADIRSLKERAFAARQQADLESFWHDRLRVYELNDAIQPSERLQPRASQERLWSVLERSQQATHTHARKNYELMLEAERIARYYGGEQWTVLKTLLVEMIRIP